MVNYFVKSVFLILFIGVVAYSLSNEVDNSDFEAWEDNIW